MKRKTSILAGVFAAAASVALPIGAPSAAVVFSSSSGSLSASASFDIVGSQLQVILTNTSASDVLVPADVLTAVFFNVTSNPLLTSVSAISGGPTYLNAVQVSAAGTVVGGEWAYLNGLSQYSVNSGISSSGLGIFGSATFPGANLAGPAAVDGLQYGITSAGDNLATQNGGIANNELTKNSVTFLLGGLPQGFLLSSISNVSFQYGTSLTEPCIGSCSPPPPPPGRLLPEPGSLALVGLGALGFGAFRRRKKLFDPNLSDK